MRDINPYMLTQSLSTSPYPKRRGVKVPYEENKNIYAFHLGYCLKRI